MAVGGASGSGGGGLHTSLVADEHPQYLFTSPQSSAGAGRSGGQWLVAGLAAGAVLGLAGAPLSAAPDTGRVEFRSPVEITYDTQSNTTPAEAFAFRWRPVVTISAPYIGGFLNTAADRTVTTPTWIPATFSSNNISRIGAALGFAAETFINYLDVQENSGNFNLASVLAFNFGVAHRRITSGTSTATTKTGFSFSPQTATTAVGAIMTLGDQIGLNVSATWNTFAFSTANLGNICGVRFLDMGQALFGSSAGLETVANVFGFDMRNISALVPTGNAVALRSAMTAAANKYHLLFTGNAQSDMGAGPVFGTGHRRIDADNFGLFLGAVQDVLLNWNGLAAEFDFLANDDFRIAANSGQHVLSTSGSGELALNFPRGLNVGDAATLGNARFQFTAGAHNITVAGGFTGANFTWSANQTIDAALVEFITWNVAAPAFAIGTGSLTGPISAMQATQTSSGVGSNETQAIMSRGRTQLRGHHQTPPINPANITADQTAYNGGLTATQSGSQRAWWRTTNDAAVTIRGINTAGMQDGDTWDWTNTGANALLFTDTDGAAAVGDQLLLGDWSGSLGPDESRTFKYDGTSGFVRVLNSN